MQRRTFLAGLATAGASLSLHRSPFAPSDTATPASIPGETIMQTTTATAGYAPVNGLRLYYEVHGADRTGIPLVLIHGGMSTIETDFGALLPTLAETRQVIAVELQGHGHTADVDRPLRYPTLADDVAGLLDHLAIESADFFGYSVGANTALALAIQRPDLAHKLVLLSGNYRPDAWPPEVYTVIEALSPEMMAGSPWHEGYLRVAPNPDAFPTLVAKIVDLDLTYEGWPDEAIRAITAPTLVIIGDADHVRPEHAVAMFRLLGGGVPGDLTGLTPSQLAILPATTHVGAGGQTELLLAMIPPFLDTET